MISSCIYATAYAFATSYGTIYDLYRNGSTPQKVAENIASYYREPYTAFFIGNVATNQSFAGITDATLQAYNFLEDAGIGNDITTDSVRVEPISNASAIVWLTWRIHPKNDVESFSWTTMYHYRNDVDLLAGIEAPGGNGTHGLDGTTVQMSSEECIASVSGTGARPPGGWEFGVSDEEIVKFSQRVPNYIDSYVMPPSKKS
ncbi:hypothetical protein P153DRAFT_179965 [Dothidotthia symphoricarpi CBS 119687]|uniref:SnoaL-like domain-containing protein n=1 Tax=Dothidotthia symphoricarpi CBS 119687 TaxID=1392245 RepID=A0A6A6AJ68_9PLEO|nr:uncharacterized protein P153DRAFT_179965 [Dothidotthia symphoricarpi CBS 119687]KAF2131850.1 hypothetical protein P153DRAFT_179965 [Dothidotthia symphoricarpi CBS 119687]